MKTRIPQRLLSLGAALCLALALPPLAAGPAQAAAPGPTLTVEFNDDGTGGNSLTDNPMRTAVLGAVEDMKTASTITTTGDIVKIELTGSAERITDWNRFYLLDLLIDGGSSDWAGLRTLDLRGMTGLREIRGTRIYWSYPRGGELLLPDGLETIGDYAFCGCEGMTLPSLPASLRTIGEFAFAACTGLTSLALPDGLRTIGDSAFDSCTSLSSVTLPDGLQTIGNQAFELCAALSGVTLPSGLQSIGNQAFYGCTALESVRFLGLDAPALGNSYTFDGASRALTLWVPSNGRGYLGAGADPVWLELVSAREIRIRTYSAAPAYTPAPSAYLLTVIGGEGGGWYRADDSVALRAVPPAAGAAFLRWEPVEGTGELADAASAETEYIMSIGDATVRAVFEAPAPPDPAGAPSESPKTGDGGFPALPGLLPAGAAALLLLRRRLNRA